MTKEQKKEYLIKELREMSPADLGSLALIILSEASVKLDAELTFSTLIEVNDERYNSKLKITTEKI